MLTHFLNATDEMTTVDDQREAWQRLIEKIQGFFPVLLGGNMYNNELMNFFQGQQSVRRQGFALPEVHGHYEAQRTWTLPRII